MGRPPCPWNVGWKGSNVVLLAQPLARDCSHDSPHLQTRLRERIRLPILHEGEASRPISSHLAVLDARSASTRHPNEPEKASHFQCGLFGNRHRRWQWRCSTNRSRCEVSHLLSPAGSVMVLINSALLERLTVTPRLVPIPELGLHNLGWSPGTLAASSRASCLSQMTLVGGLPQKYRVIQITKPCVPKPV